MPAAEWPTGGTLDDQVTRARLLIAFADGQEEAGFVMSARRMRLVARDVLELAEEVRTWRRTQFPDDDGPPLPDYEPAITEAA